MGSGLDDQDDHLMWSSSEPSAVRAWMAITIVETAAGDPPRRLPRSRGDWDARFRRMRAENRGEIADLARRLRQPNWHPAPPQIPPLPSRADYGFVVTVDDRLIGSAGVAGHGTLSVDVVLKRRGAKISASLHVHGGENLDGLTWRWRRWRWGDQRKLDVGQRVRIEVGEPYHLSLGDVRELTCYRPTTRQEARARLVDLRRAIKRYASQARAMKAYHRTRPAPRSYPRTPIRAD
jgi:hypothetical protein